MIHVDIHFLGYNIWLGISAEAKRTSFFSIFIPWLSDFLDRLSKMLDSSSVRLMVGDMIARGIADAEWTEQSKSSSTITWELVFRLTNCRPCREQRLIWRAEEPNLLAVDHIMALRPFYTRTPIT